MELTFVESHIHLSNNKDLGKKLNNIIFFQVISQTQLQSNRLRTRLVFPLKMQTFESMHGIDRAFGMNRVSQKINSMLLHKY